MGNRYRFKGLKRYSSPVSLEILSKLSELRALIRDLFGDGQNGLFFVPQPLLEGEQTLYEDSNGTTLTDANGDPVGLGLEWSRGLELGPELVTNGTFDTDLSGWSQSTAGYWQWVDGRAYHPFGGDYNDLTQSVSKVVPCEISFDHEVLTGNSTSQFFFRDKDNNLVTKAIPTGSGRMKLFSNNGLSLFGFSRISTSGAEFYIDNVSVRELPGNHLTQSVSADRPTYGTDGSLHWLEGNGSNWHLNLGQALNLETFTVVVASRLAGSNERLLDNRGTGSGGAVPGWQIKARTDASGDGVLIDDGNGHTWTWPAVARDAGTLLVQTLRYTQNNGLYREDGVDITPAGDSSAMGSILANNDGQLFTASNNIGTQSFSGEFFGGVVTSDFLSIAEIEKIEKYFADLQGRAL